MRKTISILLVVLVSIGLLVGCHKSKETNNTEGNTEAEVTSAETNTTHTSEGMTTEDESATETPEIETYALFGVDTRKGDHGKGTRSDSIILAVVDHEEKKVRLASIFRDTLVEVDKHGLTKITHAHSYGGPELALSTVNKNFDLSIDDYVTVNFINVRDLVDKMGGLEMEITKSEAKYINYYANELNQKNETCSSYISKEGTYTLDGNQAVAYSRIRSTAGGDYRRAERQREVLSAIFKKAKTLGTADAISLMSDMMKDINTNCSTPKVSSLIYYMADYEIEETKSFPRKLWGGKISDLGGLWYAVPVTLKSTAKDLHAFLYPEEEYTPSQKVKDISERIEGYAGDPNEVLPEDPALKE